MGDKGGTMKTKEYNFNFSEGYRVECWEKTLSKELIITNIDYNGKNEKVLVDAYSPLLELKEKYVPNGYTILDGANAMNIAYNLTTPLFVVVKLLTLCPFE